MSLCICVSMYLSVCLFVCLSTYLPTYLPTYPSIYLPIYLHPDTYVHSPMAAERAADSFFADLAEGQRIVQI